MLFSAPETARLDGNARSRMHAYLATIFRDAEAEAFRVGGVADHVHLIVTLPRTLSQAELVESLKKKSSKWIKELAAEDGNLLAARLWSFFGQPESAERRDKIRGNPGGTSPQPHVSGRISRVPAQA